MLIVTFLRRFVSCCWRNRLGRCKLSASRGDTEVASPPDSAEPLSCCEPHSLLRTFHGRAEYLMIVGEMDGGFSCCRCGVLVSGITPQAFGRHVHLLLAQIDLSYRRREQLSDLGQRADGGQVTPV